MGFKQPYLVAVQVTVTFPRDDSKIKAVFK
jgi:hypothetical protein